MRANNLLDAPIVPTLARLAAPGIALALFQTAVSVADTYYVGRLGTDSLAGLALVFPMLMLLQMTSAGAMGGGVSSAVARALGAGNPDAARRLVVHGLIIALGGGLFFTLFLLGAGQMLMPMLANTARLALVVAGGVLVMQLGGPLAALFAVVALGLAVYGGLTGYAVYKARWTRA